MSRVSPGVVGSAIVAAGLIAAPAFAQIQFVDVSASAGITGGGASFGASWGDLNGDGRPDIWVGNHPSPPSLYLNEGDGTFTLNVLPFPVRDTHGAAWGDFDADGDQDLIFVAGASGDNQLFVNEGGTLVDRAVQWGVTSRGARSRTPVWLDWDADGLLDLVLTQASAAQTFPTILRNTGTGFVDAASITGPVPAGTNRAQLADLTGDGRLDLVLLHGDLSQSVVYDLSTTPFTNVLTALNIPALPSNTNFAMDEVIADLTGDLNNEVFRSSTTANHELVIQSPTQIDFHLKAFQREEGVTFESSGPIEVSAFALGAFPPNTGIIQIGATGQGAGSFQFTLDPVDSAVWGIADHVAGVDDGLFAGYDPALGTWTVLLSTAGNWDANFVITSTSPMSNVQPVGFDPVPRTSFPSFLVRTATGYEERGIESQLRVPQSCFSAVGGDFDNDMDIDLYLACSWPVTNASNILFENLGNGVFAQAPDGGGASGTLEGRSDTVITADYDEDGFLDLFVTNGEGGPPFNDGPHQLFRNAGNANHWLEIDLTGRFSNADAIGARVELTAGGSVQIREQGGGMHYRAQNYKRLHFGLGSNASVDQIDIHWPSGIVQTLTNIPVDQILAVSETPDNTTPLATNDTASVDEGQLVTIDLTLNDTDADDGLDLSRIRIVNGPLNGSITSINGNGTVDYTHNGSEATTDSFSYTISDLSGTSSNEATVTITINPADFNGDGISDAQAVTLGLDPNDSDGDTDNDQITDIAEIGGDLNDPLDSDADGMIDALEPGTSAADASVVNGLQLDGGANLIIQTAASEALSNVSSEVVTGGLAGINFPFGMVNYTTTAPTGSSVTVRMSFSNDLPENLVVFKVDNAGDFTELPATLWTQADTRTIEVTLTDGDPVTDLDGAYNGSIDDPIAVGGAAATPLSDSTSGGGGGGCTLNAAADKDPTLPLLMWLSLGYLLHRRLQLYLQDVIKRAAIS